VGKVVGILIGLLIAGGAGYYYGAQQTSSLTASLEEAKRELTGVQDRERLAAMTVKAGTVMVEAQQKNFAVAREHSTMFFDSVRELEAAAPADSKVKQTMTEILTQRDAITADLAMGNDSANPALVKIFLSMQHLVP
jgi:hypothetical protein